jgi:hypothetical protein
MHDNGFAPRNNPILEPIETIRHTDAILDLTDPDALNLDSASTAQ